MLIYSYIEAHGTGTNLGDPVEINGIKKAFAELGMPKRCAIGAVKSNIGHLETAAGIAGVIKVLLAMKNGQIPGNLNFSELNSQIQLDGTGFYIADKTNDWEGDRIVGISSFGFGGVNAHVVLEAPPSTQVPLQELGRGELEIIVLSAKNKERLDEYVHDIVKFCEEAGTIHSANNGGPMGVHDIAYTLQVGRDNMEERLATVVSSVEELKNNLIKGENLYRGNIKESKKSSLLVEGEEGQEFLRNVVAHKKLNKLCELWVAGIDIDWSLLYTNSTKPRRISMPTYPFKKERYWIPEGTTALGECITTKLHALIDSNESTLREQCFRKILTGDEFYLRDHVVAHNKVLPGSVYLEMVRAGGELADKKQRVMAIRDVFWLRPIIYDGSSPKEIYLGLYPENGKVAYEVYSGEDRDIHSQGVLEYGENLMSEYINIDEIKERCSRRLGKNECYEIFTRVGLMYGEKFRTISEHYSNEEESLALLEVAGIAGDFVLHPSIIDGAFQTVVGLMGQAEGMYVPFAMEEIKIVKPTGEKCYAYANKSSSGRFDIIVADELGAVLVKIKGFEVREFVVIRDTEVEQLGRTLKYEKKKMEQVFDGGGMTDQDSLIEVVQKGLMEIVVKILKIKKEDLDIDLDMSEYGFDSISFTKFANEVNEKYGLNIMPSELFGYSSIGVFANYLCNEYKKEMTDYYPKELKTVGSKNVRVKEKEEKIRGKERFVLHPTEALEAKQQNMPIAIVGMAGIMPKSPDLEIFWDNLINGVDMISPVPVDRFKSDTQFYGGFIPDIDKFDPLFFGISPKEAELMDPQQRIFMQVVWQAIEDAGYKTLSLSGSKTGLFVGVASADYHELLKENEIEIQAQTSTGLAHSVLANRISYLLNIHGPSEPIDTACSSSLVAIHRAVQSIYMGDCDMAIAGGVNAMLTETLFESFSKAGMLSADGKCKTFDKAANGYVRGEGAGAVLLKPLYKAVEDRDHIYAVIKGTAVNHGGHANSLTAPNPNAQAELIKDAWRKSGLDTSKATYLEAHGTGTSLGDPIEINGLNKAFSELGMPKKCAIGAVKSNMGHLETAAGIAGVLKVLMMMKHGKIPGNLHYGEMNPQIQLNGTGFYIADRTMDWEGPKIAGISSFGFGGVNAHVVLEGLISPQAHILQLGKVEAIILSAKNKDRLDEYIHYVIDYLDKNTNISLSDLAYTLQIGREAMEERLAVLVSSIDELKEKLKNMKDIYRQNVNQSNSKHLVIDGEKGELYLNELIQHKKLENLCRLWVSGVDINWSLLYKNAVELPQRMSLPTHPFEKKRYWFDSYEDKKKTFKSTEIKRCMPAKVYNNMGDDIKNFDSDEVTLDIIDEHTNTVEYIENMNDAEEVKLNASINDVKERLIDIFANSLHLQKEQIPIEENFKDIGVDSITSVKIARDIDKQFELSMDAMVFYDYPTIESLSNYIFENEKDIHNQNDEREKVLKANRDMEEQEKVSLNTKVNVMETDHISHITNASNNDELKENKSKDSDAKSPYELNTCKDIAIIGISCRFPGADNKEQFWQNLVEGKTSISEVPKDRWNTDDYYDPEIVIPNKTNCKWGGFLEDIDKFDFEFFNISENEAKLMDPQQRLFLEEAWKALQDAGYSSKALSNLKCGVFVGACVGDYIKELEKAGKDHELGVFTGMSSSILSSRLSYFLNLTGPSISIDTACSSSLVATHLACQSILNKESEIAIAGGVTLINGPDFYIDMTRMQMLSPTGKPRPFDNDADGVIFSEGVGVIVLKSLKKALQDKDNIYAVIKGSGVNQDGRTNGITSSSIKSQYSLEVDVYKRFDIDLERMGFVEAHGTGTKIGDAIEFNALKKAYEDYTNRKQFCAIGSVKGNIGHAGMAAGVSSIIKAVLALKNGMLPMSLNFKEANEHICFEDSPFYLNGKLLKWEKEETPRLAAVSSFGFSGTNCHIVLEKYEGDADTSKNIFNNEPEVIILSAKNKKCLKEYTQSFIEFLEENDNILVNDLAYTVQFGREEMEERIAFKAYNTNEVIKILKYYVEQEKLKDGCWGNVKDNLKVKKMLTDQKIETEIVNLMKQKNIDKLMELWVLGLEVDWGKMDTGKDSKKIPLPTYPFEKQRCWISEADINEIAESESNNLSALVDIPISSENKTSVDVIVNELKILLSELLGVDAESIDLNKPFAFYGIDSILISRIKNRITQKYPIKITPYQFFEYDTIAKLSEFIGSNIENNIIEVEGQKDTNQPNKNDKHVVELSFEQKRQFAVAKMYLDKNSLTVPIAYRLKGKLEIELLRQSIKEIVKRHEALRTVFIEEYGIVKQVVLKDIEFDIDQKLSLMDIQKQTFDLENGPLFKISLSKSDEVEYIFVLTFHHIISDFWSVALFIDELCKIYTSLYNNKKDYYLPKLEAQYKDYVAWEKDYYDEIIIAKRKAYWQNILIKRELFVKLPYDKQKNMVTANISANVVKELSEETINRLEEFCEINKITPFNVLMAVWKLLLYANSEDEFICVGMPVLNRDMAHSESIIGLLSMLSLVCCNISPKLGLNEFITDIGRNIAASIENLLPLSNMIEMLMPQNKENRSTMIQTVFSYVSNTKIEKISLPQVMEATLIEMPRPYLDFELFLTVIKSKSGYVLSLDYLKEIFELSTIKNFLCQFEKILDFVITKPNAKIAEIFDILKLSRKKKIVIAANFTAEPVERPLNFWMKELEIPSTINFEGYNQIFQSLIKEDSIIRTNNNGVNIIFLRLEEWGTDDRIFETCNEFIEVLKQALKDGHGSYLLCICDDSPDIDNNGDWVLLRKNVIKHIKGEIDNFINIQILDDKDIRDLYPVNDYFDSVQMELGHIPYTDEYFAALATAISRRYYAMLFTPCKAIVLDCDNTLWKGIVEEDGIDGIKIDSSMKEFQRFIVQQQEAGVLICLCSKNEESAVNEVFEKRKDMILKKEHIVSWRINWNEKSTNIKSLAEELNLGLDSFVFIDDNEIECEEIKANCPSVTVIKFDDKNIKNIIKHAWIFDRVRITTEDKKRTESYKQNFQRNELNKSGISFEDFLTKLEIDLDIRSMDKTDIGRVSQLANKTNQFNSTTIRRSETEIANLVKQQKYSCHTIRVKDRFGDYGLAGVVISEIVGNIVRVDSFILSCRVLGRRVEHKISGWLAEFANKNGADFVQFDYIPTQKNQPVLAFFESVGANCKESNEKGIVYKVPVHVLVENVEKVDEKTQISDTSNINEVSSAIEQKSGQIGLNQQALVNKTIGSYSDINSILAAMENCFGYRKRNEKAEYAHPKTSTEVYLCEILSQVLRQDKISVNDDFFEIGGTSLDAVQVLTKIRTSFKVPLTYDVFANNTSVAAIARAIDFYLNENRFDVRDVKTIELLNEAVLPDDISLEGCGPICERPRKALLTGATGHLGAYILVELLEQTKFTVHCLVRAKNADEGISRVKENINKYGMWKEIYKNRICVILGDFALPLFGLEQKEFDKLCRQIDVIYHNGALVNFVYPYAKLKQANVGGTLEVMRMAGKYKLKPVHYVSTNSIFDGTDKSDEIILETHITGDGNGVLGGYAQTKWVCEMLLTKAIEKGYPVTIYRPSGISPSTDNSAKMPMTDAFTAIMLTCIDTGYAPDFDDAVIDFSSVDYVAKAILQISLQKNAINKVFHLSHPRFIRLGKMLEKVVKIGQALTIVPYLEWVEKVKKYSESSLNKNIAALLPIFEDKLYGVDKTWFEVVMTRTAFDTKNANEFLKKSGIHCHDIDEGLIRHYLLLCFMEIKKLSMERGN